MAHRAKSKWTAEFKRRYKRDWQRAARGGFTRPKAKKGSRTITILGVRVNLTRMGVTHGTATKATSKTSTK